MARAARPTSTAPAAATRRCGRRSRPWSATTSGSAGSSPRPETTRPDVTVSLGPVSSGTLGELAETLGGLPRVLLRETEPAGAAEPLVQAASPEMPGPAERNSRYQLFGEIARGGMGAVLKGRDPDLGREVAVKVLLEEHRGDVELVRRFVEEAQIGGQLQHPGIVPVYDVGSFADRRPFFSMKLVKGRTLAAAAAGSGPTRPTTCRGSWRSSSRSARRSPTPTPAA